MSRLVTYAEATGISAGFLRLRPMERRRKIASGKFATEFLHPDGIYRTEPPPSLFPTSGRDGAGASRTPG
jgi:hypothetical protein